MNRFKLINIPSASSLFFTTTLSVFPAKKSLALASLGFIISVCITITVVLGLVERRNVCSVLSLFSLESRKIKS